MAKWAQSIFVQSVLVILSQTIPAKLSVAYVLVITLGVVLEAVSFSDHVSLGFRCFDYIGADVLLLI